VVAAAPEAPSGAMTLEQALDYAHAHRPDLRGAVARIAAAESSASATRARWYPTVFGVAEALVGTTNNTTGSYVGVGGIDNPRVSATRADSQSDASFQPAVSTLAGLGVRQEVYDFGAIAARAAADDMRVRAERATSDDVRLVADYDVEEAYFAVLAAKRVLDAAEKAYTRTAVHRDYAKAGVDSGMRRPIELTRAEAALDRYEIERIRARAGVAKAQATFAASISAPQPLLDIAGDPPEPRALPSAAAVRDAIGRNPELLRALADVEAQRATTKAIGTETRPNLFLTGALTGNAGGATPTGGDVPAGSGLLPIVPNWDVGLVLSWPIFDETVTKRAKASEHSTEAADARATSVRRTLVAEVESAYVDVSASHDALAVLDHSLKAAIANYDQASARFDVGVGNAVELADAEELRTEAEIDLALGNFDFARTRAALARLATEPPR
ncbi:MAG TPA: TolC family protein, partial [Polyangiaceae bacterium]